MTWQWCGSFHWLWSVSLCYLSHIDLEEYMVYDTCMVICCHKMIMFCCLYVHSLYMLFYCIVGFLFHIHIYTIYVICMYHTHMHARTHVPTHTHIHTHTHTHTHRHTYTHTHTYTRTHTHRQTDTHTHTH